MTEAQTDAAQSVSSHPQRNCSVTTSGAISDPSLSQLREQIKSIMIPLLIKVFHLKLEAQQASSPPSRLQNKHTSPHADEIISQLQKLDEDLKLLMLWCQSGRNQVNKVLSEAQEEMKTPYSTQLHSQAQAHPAVQKSFSEAVASQQETFKTTKSLHSSNENKKTLSEEPAIPKNNWWNRIRRH